MLDKDKKDTKDEHLSKQLSTYGVKGIMMEPTEIAKLKALNDQIQIIKTAALELKNLSGGVQAADCNANRILASAKMLEINFSDLLTVL